MGDTLGFHTVKAARKAHRCSYCGEAIETGQSYTKWLWVERGDRADCRMHPECYDYYDDTGDGEFSLFDNERPSPAPKTGGET